MDLEEALTIVWEEVARRGQNRVAGDLAVSNGTPTKWRKGARPEGEVRERVIAFAETTRQRRVADRVVRETGQGDDYALGVIRGQAEAARRYLVGALQEQERVIQGLDNLGAIAPVSRAKLDETGRRQLAVDAAKTRRSRGTK